MPATKSHRFRWRKSADVRGDEADENQQRRQQHVSSIKGSGRTFAVIGWTALQPARMSPGMTSSEKLVLGNSYSLLGTVIPSWE
ncbi:hypothetical protein K0M31_004348 [Melipona bicolor]|uniref:Uncharacterized protein n=1 Tax=Melipona bicolor TaxID=60889 RepID=A0AA40KN98_9HYME|nr:hypothetical protein K0M31_004348 [Melipona bicolor]